MLTETIKEEIKAELTHAVTKESASIGALNIVQRHKGWISDDDLADVANLLGMTTDELDAVATFYNYLFRKPVGRHVILVCDSISCFVMGCNPVIDLLKDRLGINLGETTTDKRFTLLPAACLGACNRAPVMMVDDDLHGPVAAERIDDILEKYQ